MSWSKCERPVVASFQMLSAKQTESLDWVGQSIRIPSLGMTGTSCPDIIEKAIQRCTSGAGYRRGALMNVLVCLLNV